MAITWSWASTRRSSTGPKLALANGVNSSKSSSGTLMIMDTKTGAIDAWAQYPSYNANSYASANIADFRDLAVAQPYEPGSIMKVITFAGGLNHNAFTPSTVIDEKQQRIDGFLIHDWDRRSHGKRDHAVGARTTSLNNGASTHEDGGRETRTTTICSPSGSAPDRDRPGGRGQQPAGAGSRRGTLSGTPRPPSGRAS